MLQMMNNEFNNFSEDAWLATRIGKLNHLIWSLSPTSLQIYDSPIQPPAQVH